MQMGTRPAASLLTALLVACPFASATEPIPENLSAWIAKLGAESYVSRQTARGQLYRYATGGPGRVDVVIGALSAGGDPHEDLERFLARESLARRLRDWRRQRQLDRLLNDPSFDAHSLAGWTTYSRWAGCDRPARQLFADALDRDPSFGSALLHPGSCAVTGREPTRIAGDDQLGWAMVLCLAMAGDCPVVDRRCVAINAALRNDGSGPLVRSDRPGTVLSRLIAAYLNAGKADAADSLVIAARYRCDAVAMNRAALILDDPAAPASQIITAMLVASVIESDSERVDRWIRSFRSDGRTGYVWRSLTPPKAVRRTQVRDVALAVMLHRRGVDPRGVGFTALQADPILVYRPYSLGFADPADRRRCHRRGWDAAVAE